MNEPENRSTEYRKDLKIALKILEILESLEPERKLKILEIVAKEA